MTVVGVKAGAQERVFVGIGMGVTSIWLTVMKSTGSKLGMKGHDRRKC